jgi:hypothetical protein
MLARCTAVATLRSLGSGSSTTVAQVARVASSQRTAGPTLTTTTSIRHHSSHSRAGDDRHAPERALLGGVPAGASAAVLERAYVEEVARVTAGTPRQLLPLKIAELSQALQTLQRLAPQPTASGRAARDSAAGQRSFVDRGADAGAAAGAAATTTTTTTGARTTDAQARAIAAMRAAKAYVKKRDEPEAPPPRWVTLRKEIDGAWDRSVARLHESARDADTLPRAIRRFGKLSDTQHLLECRYHDSSLPCHCSMPSSGSLRLAHAASSLHL